MNTTKFLQIEPTTRCNYICGFCVGRHMHQTDLSLHTGDRVFEVFGKLEAVELQGEGEPFLHQDFFHIAKSAAQAGTKISIITNGSLLREERIQQIPSYPIERGGISLQSQEESQFQAIRGRSFAKVLRGVRRLKKARDLAKVDRPMIGLNVTVLKSALRHAEAIIDLLSRTGT